GSTGMDRGCRCQDRLHRARQPLGERVHRELQRSPARRAARRRNLLHSPRGPNRHRELAAALQHDQAARIARIQAASSGGICPCLRRVAGCATPTGSAGHASATASLKLTFHLDHSVGANHDTAVDYARVLKDLADIHFAHAKTIVLVHDNLSIHSKASLYEAFPAVEARRLVERFEWHYTPKHGSWLNLAESELGVLTSQCLDRRIPNKQILIDEIATWEHD